jgi:hypothetical protein
VLFGFFDADAEELEGDEPHWNRTP